ncbi:hypothetical protein QYF36_002685 [Acer negundo]|nr:hypothetical protein QYF36_002685 [Acer negundo]
MLSGSSFVTICLLPASSSFLRSHTSPIWVPLYLVGGKIYEIGSTGISSLGGHIERRTECVNRFVARVWGDALGINFSESC